MSSRPARSGKTLIFLHIPKTAGTTLDQIVFRQYRYKQVYETGLIAQEGVNAYQNMSVEARAGYRLLKGHMDFGIHRYVPGPYAYFTFLREPVERTISHFYFIFRSQDHPHFQLIQENGLGMKEYLAQKLEPMLFNAHTRILSGVWDSVPAGECTAEHLAEAKENLQNQIQVFGLTERFDESLLLLGKAFGWKRLYYKRLNVARKRPRQETLPPDFISAVEQANLLDIELYAFALGLFEEQIEKAGPGFSAEVKKFRQINRLVQPLAAINWEMRKISVGTFLERMAARFQ